MRWRALRSPAGFTLMEMLVSVTIVAMMCVVLWSVLRTSIRSWVRGTETIDTLQRQRTLADLIRKQMASIYGITIQTPMEPGIIPYPVFSGARDSMQFVSLCSLRFEDNPGLTLVSYDVVRDRRGEYAMVEREAQYLGLDSTRESIFDRKDDTALPIFENLSVFTLEYFHPGNQDRPAAWLQEWNSKEMGRLPAAISLTMSLRDGNGRPVNRQIVVPVQAMPYDARTAQVNPLEMEIRRLGEDVGRRIR